MAKHSPLTPNPCPFHPAPGDGDVSLCELGSLEETIKPSPGFKLVDGGESVVFAVTCPYCHATGPVAEDIDHAVLLWNGSMSAKDIEGGDE